MPTATPTPNPNRKLESPFVSIVFLLFSDFQSDRKAVRRKPFLVYSPMRTRNMETREPRGPREPRRLDADALWQYALKILAGRAHSAGEMREKLRRRAERAGDVDEALSRLKDLGYLDDRRFAEGFAAARLAGDGLGRTRVTQDLRRPSTP
jgi:hypothetical protein